MDRNNVKSTLLVAVVGAVLLMVATPSWAEEVTYRSGERTITLELETDVVAVEGRRAMARQGAGFLPELQGYADQPDEDSGQATPQQRALQRWGASENFFFVRAKSGQSEAAITKLRSEGARSAGIVARFAREGVPEENQAYAILTNEFIVYFRPNMGREDVKALAAEHGAAIVRPMVRPRREDAPRGYVMRSVNGTPQDSVRLSQKFASLDATVGVAEPNLILQRARRSDPLFDRQWHLDNTGQGGGKAGADVRASQAWTISKGSRDIVVAVIDNGIEINHEDLLPNRFTNEAEANGVPGKDDDDNGLEDDVHGWNFMDFNGDVKSTRPHGTACAGIAVAAENGKGVVGIAPGCTLLAIRQGYAISDDADAILYAALMGADVISCSWGYAIGTPQTETIERTLTLVASEGRGGRGCVICFAMTNEKLDNFGGDVEDISSHPDVLAIGRSTNKDVWGHSGYGKGMALLAPSGAARGTRTAGCDPEQLSGTLEITTTDLTGTRGYNAGTQSSCPCNTQVSESVPPEYTSCFGGTSASTPLVAGIAALVLSVNPNLTREQVREVLIETADKIEPERAGYQPDSSGRLYSSTHGYGRVNAHSALRRAQATLTPTIENWNGMEGLRQSVRRAEGSLDVLVLRGAWGLGLRSGTSAADVLEALPEVKAVEASWAKQFSESRNMLIVQGADLSASRLGSVPGVASVGRVVVQRTRGGDVPYVMLTEFRLNLATDSDLEHLADSPALKNWKVVSRDKLRKGGVTVRLINGGDDPLEWLSSLQELRKSVDITSIEPKWVVAASRGR